MKRKFYITTNTAGLTPAEIKAKIDAIVFNLKIIGVGDDQIFRTDSIDSSLTFNEEIEIRMNEIAKADVCILDYEANTWMQGEIELKEASRLSKHIRMNRLGDFEDIKKHFIEID